MGQLKRTNEKGANDMFATTLVLGLSLWSFLGILLLVLIGTYILVGALNRTALRRMSDAASAQVGKAAHTLWAQDPLAVKNAEIDRKAEELAEATRGLESCRAL